MEKKARHFAQLAYDYAMDRMETTGEVFEGVSVDYYAKSALGDEDFTPFFVVEVFKKWSSNAEEAIFARASFSVTDTDEELQESLECYLGVINNF